MHHYISLTKLIPESLDMVNNKEMPFNATVELSHLQKEEQKAPFDYMYAMDVILTLKQAKALKRKSQEKKLTMAEMWILDDEDQLASVRIVLQQKNLEQHFPKGYSQKEMEDVIFSLLQKWKKYMDEYSGTV